MSFLFAKYKKLNLSYTFLKSFEFKILFQFYLCKNNHYIDDSHLLS